MKNVLFIHAQEKDKAIFFSSLAQFLNLNDIKTQHLAFTRLEKKIYEENNIESVIFLPKQLKKYSGSLDRPLEGKYEINEILYYTRTFNKLNNFNFNESYCKKNICKFINYLESNFIDKCDMIIIWNDTFMFDRAAKQFALNHDIPITIFESGLFRPNTITVDHKGVNFGNSVPQHSDYFLNKEFANDYVNTEKNFFKNNIEAKKIYIAEKIADFFYEKVLKNELSLKFNFESILKKIKRKLKSYISKISMTDYSQTISTKKYIFVPFQVHDDSQIILNSKEIKSMDQLVERIFGQVELYNKGFLKYDILFKEHPADLGRIDYSSLYHKFKNCPNVYFLKNGSTDEILENSDLVITINSTVGIEALIKHKPVITLGDAFYNIDGIVKQCNDINQLHSLIKEASEGEVNITLIDNFLDYLRNVYQVEGDWRKGVFEINQMKKKLKSIFK